MLVTTKTYGLTFYSRPLCRLISVDVHRFVAAKQFVVHFVLKLVYLYLLVLAMSLNV